MRIELPPVLLMASTAPLGGSAPAVPQLASASTPPPPLPEPYRPPNYTPLYAGGAILLVLALVVGGFTLQVLRPEQDNLPTILGVGGIVIGVIGTLFGLVNAATSAAAAVHNSNAIQQVGGEVQTQHVAFNSRVDQIVELTDAKARAEGAAAGKAEGEAIASAQTAAIADAVAVVEKKAADAAAAAELAAAHAAALTVARAAAIPPAVVPPLPPPEPTR